MFNRLRKNRRPQTSCPGRLFSKYYTRSCTDRVCGKRFAKELGSSVELQEKTFVAGPALMEALIAGEVDIGYIGPIPAINGYVQGADISIISGANNGGAVLVAGENSGIKK